MREIKFRGKRLRDGQWEYGWLVIQPDGTAYISRYFKKGEWVQVDPATVGQFIGLCDKNKWEIYEGDILRQEFCKTVRSYELQEDYIGHHIGVVTITPSKGVCMRNPLCYLDDADGPTVSNQYKSVASYRCEVIGNIWENPDLLEKGAVG